MILTTEQRRVLSAVEHGADEYGSMDDLRIVRELELLGLVSFYRKERHGDMYCKITNYGKLELEHPQCHP